MGKSKIDKIKNELEATIKNCEERMEQNIKYTNFGTVYYFSILREAYEHAIYVSDKYTNKQEENE